MCNIFNDVVCINILCILHTQNCFLTVFRRVTFHADVEGVQGKTPQVLEAHILQPGQTQSGLQTAVVLISSTHMYLLVLKYT